MTFNFGFRTVESAQDLGRLLDFLRTQELNYPEYQRWVERTEYEIWTGYKTGVIAVSNGLIVGDAIWQQHKELPDTREIKNIRIHPSVRERYFASFLLRQAETDGQGFSSLVLDYREDHPDREALSGVLISMGYQKLFTANLYDPTVRDVVMVKQMSLPD